MSHSTQSAEVSSTQHPSPSAQASPYALLQTRSHKLHHALNLAQHRENFRWAFSYTSLCSLFTLGVGMVRGQVPPAMAMYAATCWVGTGYLYDLGYGSMVHRVNKEAHRILLKDMEEH